MKFSDNNLLVVVLSLCFIGLLALLSAASGVFFFKQLVYLIIALGLIALAYYSYSISFLDRMAIPLYWINLVLLITLKVIGVTQLGAKRWISLGPINIQPSEIAKICLILFLAHILSRRPINTYWDILKVFLYIAPPSLLVLIQPDLGTTLVYIAISFGMIFWAGASIVQILVLVSPLIVAITACFGDSLIAFNSGIINYSLTMPVLVFIIIFSLILIIYYKVWNSPVKTSLVLALITFYNGIIALRPIVWGFFKEYQQRRLTIFLDPYADPLGAGYHIIQSLYAIGSGGVMGAGYKSGDLSQGGFVPEQHTDFIFSLLGEEFGLIGALATVILFAILTIMIVKRAESAKDTFSSLLAIGIVSMLLFHIFVNIGMNLSVMPITGVPLPFISYGGTSLVVNLFLMSIIAKIHLDATKY